MKKTSKEERKATHVKITTLKPFIIGIDKTDAGESRLWKILEIMPKWYKIGNKNKVTFLPVEEIISGERHSEPNFSIPTGLHLKLELINIPTLWQKIKSIFN